MAAADYNSQAVRDDLIPPLFEEAYNLSKVLNTCLINILGTKSHVTCA